MIYDVTCESFKKRIQNRQQVAVPAWMKHDENELRNQFLFPKFPIDLYSARNEDLLFIGLWHIQLENLSVYWYMIYYKPNAKIYNIRR